MATVLVVDDNGLNRSVLTTLLGYQGHRLVDAASGNEAIDKTLAEHPELIITDILTPNVDGYELVQKLRALELPGQTPIIFYSATYLEGEAQALARACGVSRVICKPAEPDYILKGVDEALASDEPTNFSGAVESTNVVAAIRVLNERLYQKVAEVLVSVADSGCGIDAERVFDRLYQLKDAISASRKGWGWGCISARN
jgi:CheY-like chemotaxis protein